MPDTSEVQLLRLGDLELLAVPAEPVAAVAKKWRDRFGPTTEVGSLATDYIGYVETPEALLEDTGESGKTYFGPTLDERLEASLAEARKAIEAAQPPLPPPPIKAKEPAKGKKRQKRATTAAPSGVKGSR